VKAPRLLDRLLVTPEWSSIPGKVCFFWCLLDLALFGALALSGDRGADGVIVEIASWVPISLFVARLLPRSLGVGSYLSVVVALSLSEETIAYSTGGGLHGAATSLPENWVRSVPTFAGLALGLLLAVRSVGLRSPETFTTAAAAGIFLEIGLGSGFNPVALFALSGAVAWVYGTIVALPCDRPAPRKPDLVRVAVTIALVVVGTLGGGALGLALQALFHL